MYLSGKSVCGYAANASILVEVLHPWRMCYSYMHSKIELTITSPNVADTSDKHGHHLLTMQLQSPS